MGVLEELLNRFLPARRDQQVAELAERLAREQQPRVWRLLAARAGTLGSEAEARGYIRCRARRVLRRGLRRLGESAQLPANLQRSVIDRALELTFGRFAGSMMQPVAVSREHRRAA